MQLAAEGRLSTEELKDRISTSHSDVFVNLTAYARPLWTRKDLFGCSPLAARRRSTPALGSQVSPFQDELPSLDGQKRIIN